MKKKSIRITVILILLIFCIGICVADKLTKLDVFINTDCISHVDDKNECPFSDHPGDIYSADIEFINIHLSSIVSFSLDSMAFEDFSVSSGEYPPSCFPIRHNENCINSMYFLFNDESVDKEKAVNQILKHKYKYRYRFTFNIFNRIRYLKNR